MNWRPITAAAGIGFLGAAMAAPTELWRIACVILAAVGLLTVAGGILWALASDDDRREMGVGDE